MSQIIIKFDNILEQSDIVVPLLTPGPDQVDPESNQDQNLSVNDINRSDIKQTSVYGIQTPLIAINQTVIPFDDIISISLNGLGKLPSLDITIMDTSGLIEYIDKPTQDNEVRLQIIPAYDNAYKKINLTFYMSRVSIRNGIVSAHCIYKLPALVSDQIRSFGKISTYKLFETIACETGLGFATNTEEFDDQRYIYCANCSLMDLMENEIQRSGDPTTIFDFWVDFWNNLNFVNVRDRYEGLDAPEDMLVWVHGQPTEAHMNVEVQPEQIASVLTNSPVMQMSDLYVREKNTINTGNNGGGSDRVISIYEESRKEYLDHLIQNGDVYKDIFVKYEYAGEVYGDVNYLFNSQCHDIYMECISKEIVEVITNSPTLGLMRGKQTIFNWYYNNDYISDKIKKLQEEGIAAQDSELKSNIDMDDNTPDNEDQVEDGGQSTAGQFELDKTISGQYLIIGNIISYEKGNWTNKIRLVRPNNSKPSYLNKAEG